MRIAVDAMGGDYAPAEIVAGVAQAARDLQCRPAVTLVGDEGLVRAELARHGAALPNVQVIHASETIGMGESPAQAVRKKKDSSINRCVDLVKRGEADAAVSAGNTGAMVVAASLKLRTLEGVHRPAIATVMPTCAAPFVLIDAGANTDCEPKLLAQFAAMGTVYSREIMRCPNPVVGLLSIGGEESKGNEVTREVFRRLTASPLNFRGNVEGNDLFNGGIDVVVCDGFVGNVVLKTSESAAHAIATFLRRELTSTLVRRAGALILKNAFASLKTKVSPETYGGAPLLGVNGLCVIAHGGSNRRAVFHAIRVACESVNQKLNDAIVGELRRTGF